MKIFTDNAGNTLHLTEKYIYAKNNEEKIVTNNGLKFVMKEAKKQGKISYDNLKIKKIGNKKFLKLPIIEQEVKRCQNVKGKQKEKHQK